MAKFSPKNYWHPTPKKLRALGDALLGTFSGITIAVLLDALNEQDKSLRTAKVGAAITSILLGTLGKYLTNCYKEGEEDEDGKAE